MKHVALVAAIILFVVAAVAFFWIDTWKMSTDLGLVAAGLACLAFSLLPLAEIISARR